MEKTLFFAQSLYIVGKPVCFFFKFYFAMCRMHRKCPVTSQCYLIFMCGCSDLIFWKKFVYTRQTSKLFYFIIIIINLHAFLPVYWLHNIRTTWLWLSFSPSLTCSTYYLDMNSDNLKGIFVFEVFPILVCRLLSYCAEFLSRVVKVILTHLSAH